MLRTSGFGLVGGLLLVGIGCATRSLDDECDPEVLAENLACPEGSSPTFAASAADVASLELDPQAVSGTVTYGAEASCAYGCEWAPQYANQGGTCSTRACGGDPVGTWDYGPTCFASGPFETETCPGSTVSIYAEIRGTLDLRANGSFTDTITDATTNYTFYFGASCTSGASDCSEFKLYAGDDCVGDPAEGCACTGVSQSNQTEVYTGTWSQGGTTLSRTYEGVIYSGEFCQDGNQLTIIEDDGYTFTLSR